MCFISSSSLTSLSRTPLITFFSKLLISCSGLEIYDSIIHDAAKRVKNVLNVHVSIPCTLTNLDCIHSPKTPLGHASAKSRWKWTMPQRSYCSHPWFKLHFASSSDKLSKEA